MYYLRDGIARLGKPGLGKVLAAVFAVCCVGGSLGGGNMFQSNQATALIVDVTGGGLDNFRWAIGLVFAVAVGLVIIGGIKSIARVTDKVVPFMAVLYVTACIIVIGANVSYVPAAFGEIISGAFSPEGITGGVVGRAHRRLPAGRILQRGRRRFGIDRSLRGPDQGAGHRGLRLHCSSRSSTRS